MITHLQNFITHTKGASFVSGSLWIDTANEDCHSCTILVTRKADSQPLVVFLELNKENTTSKISILLFNFIWNQEKLRSTDQLHEEKLILLFYVIRDKPFMITQRSTLKKEVGDHMKTKEHRWLFRKNRGTTQLLS